jgi:hypothetical protein
MFPEFMSMEVGLKGAKTETRWRYHGHRRRHKYWAARAPQRAYEGIDGEVPKIVSFEKRSGL